MLNNSIVWGNSNSIYVNSDSAITLNYSDYTNDITGSGTVTADPNCITTDPLFVDSANGNYRLQNSPTLSPGINAGSNALVPIGITTDLAGNPRFSPAGGTVDLGAYEYQP